MTSGYHEGLGWEWRGLGGKGDKRAQKFSIIIYVGHGDGSAARRIVSGSVTPSYVDRQEPH